jgi:regulator of sigma E protease
MFTTIAAFLFVLGVLIFVHELGHFLMARLHGVRVLRFSLGFDPKIVRFERGGTEYSIGVIPLGGFVKLAGENVDDQRTGAPDEFLSKSKWVRFQVYLAGPVMNILLAFVLLTVTLSQGADVPLFESAAPVIGKVTAGSPAEKAGLRPGDQIVRFGDKDVATWEQLERAVMPETKHELDVVALRNGTTIHARITPEALNKYEVGTIGIVPVIRPQFIGIEPNSPAAHAGLQQGDVLIALNGDVLDRDQVLGVIRKNTGHPLRLTVERHGSRTDLMVTPEKRGDIGMIGATISAAEVRRIEPNLLQAAQMSVQRNWETMTSIAETLSGLFRGQTPVRQLMGPVAIAQLSGNAAQLGLKVLLELMAMISLNLGLINLLPVPVMDGGQIAILGFEWLIRRDLSMRVKERILMAGAALIVALMVTVIYNDIMRIIK